MAVLHVNCTVDRAKRPVWMKRLMSALSKSQWKQYDGTLDELKGIRSGVECFIRQLKLSGLTQLDLSTEIATGNVLLVMKNGKAFLTAQFK
jgi:hypothetical protein